MKIQSNFGIDISAKPHRQSIHEAVGQIKASLRDNRMVLQRNIQYGMARNIFGGSIAAIVASAVLVTVSLFLGQKTAIHISIALLIFYSLLGLAAYRSIRSAANDYAHMLYDEFLAN